MPDYKAVKNIAPSQGMVFMDKGYDYQEADQWIREKGGCFFKLFIEALFSSIGFLISPSSALRMKGRERKSEIRLKRKFLIVDNLVLTKILFWGIL